MEQASNSFRLSYVLCCMAIVGCTSKLPAVSPATPNPVLKAPVPTAYKINNPLSKLVGVPNHIRVVQVLTSAVDAKLLVQVELLNQRGSRQVLDYRMRWLDAYGVQVVEYEPWSAVSLEEKESSVLTFRAPRDSATDFKLELKKHY